jgi:pimeloyl-ACP methyl ester carboxylesterase
MPLRHVVTGSGPPLLLLHGIGMSSAAWTRVTPHLGGFECHAVDLPGFGASAPLDGPATMAALAHACRASMAARGHVRFHVAGNSLGGGIALHLALDGTALTACGLSPVGFAEGWERAWLHLSLMATRASGPVLERVMPVIGRAGAVRRAVMVQHMAHGERLPLGDMVAGFGDLNAGAGFAGARRHAVNWRCPAVPGELPCPVTVAWGDKDRLLLQHPQAARARDRLPRARHLVLADTGHLPAWDDPVGVAEVVRDAAAEAAPVLL